MNQIQISQSAGSNSVMTRNNEVFINGEKIETPKGMKTGSQAVVDGKIYIGGYEFQPKTKTFKKTMVAWFHLYF